MKADLQTRHGGKILADALVGHGVELAFGVPGESFLPVLDGIYDVREKLPSSTGRKLSPGTPKAISTPWPTSASARIFPPWRVFRSGFMQSPRSVSN